MSIDDALAYCRGCVRGEKLLSAMAEQKDEVRRLRGELASERKRAEGLEAECARKDEALSFFTLCSCDGAHEIPEQTGPEGLKIARDALSQSSDWLAAHDAEVRRAWEKNELFLAIRKSWSKDTAFDPETWTSEFPETGQCAITALLVFEKLGGEILRAGSVKYQDDNLGSHYFNKLADGTTVDLTQGQFSEPYSLLDIFVCGKERITQNHDTMRRYEILRNRVGSSTR